MTRLTHREAAEAVLAGKPIMFKNPVTGHTQEETNLFQGCRDLDRTSLYFLSTPQPTEASMPFDPTQNRIQTMHLTTDELAALKAAKHGWLGSDNSGVWGDFFNQTPSWIPCVVYRAKPAPAPTPDVVPWDAIDARIIACCRNPNGRAWGFESLPRIIGDRWDAPMFSRQIDGCVAGYVRGTCDWRDSLQQRPAHAMAMVGLKEGV